MKVLNISTLGATLDSKCRKICAAFLNIQPELCFHIHLPNSLHVSFLCNSSIFTPPTYPSPSHPHPPPTSPPPPNQTVLMHFSSGYIWMYQAIVGHTDYQRERERDLILKIIMLKVHDRNRLSKWTSLCRLFL